MKSGGLIREGAAELFTLSPGERAGVRAIFSLTAYIRIHAASTLDRWVSRHLPLTRSGFCVMRHECRAPFLLAVNLCFYALLSLVAAQCLAGVDTNAIPPLRPPRADLEPGYWEQHAAATIGVSVGVLAMAALLVWRLTRPKPPVLVPPEVLARRALDPLQARPEDGTLLSEVSQIMRRYVAAAFDLAPGEMTTAEFCRIMAASKSVGPELASAMDTFMRRCDEKKFSPSPPKPPLNAARQGLVLLEQAEARRAELRRAEETRSN